MPSQVSKELFSSFLRIFLATLAGGIAQGPEGAMVGSILSSFFEYFSNRPSMTEASFFQFLSTLLNSIFGPANSTVMILMAIARNLFYIQGNHSY